jgi:hypothetical protein
MTDAAGGRQEVSGDELRLLADKATVASVEVGRVRDRARDIVNGLDRRGWNAAGFDDQWARTRFGLSAQSLRLADTHAELLQRSAEADLLNTPMHAVDDLALTNGGPLVATARAGMTVAATETTPLSVADWSPEQRIEFAIQRMLAHLPDELRRQMQAVLTPETLAWMVGILVVWVAGHAFGYGEVVDVGLAAVGLLMLGPEAIRAGQEAGEFVGGVAGAETADDLDAAGGHLATVVSIVGIDGLMALLAHKTGTAVRDAVGDGVVAPPRLGAQRIAVTAEGVEVILPPGFDPPPGAEILEMAGGETPSTAVGKTSHRVWSDAQRATGEFDEVGGPIDDAAGDPIKVARRVDLDTGQPQPDARLQVSKPDAVNYAQGRIVDLKPLGRAISKDRQEIIRFIRAYEQREGHLPQTIEIQRYDSSMTVVSVETYTPADFLPAVPASADLVP